MDPNLTSGPLVDLRLHWCWLLKLLLSSRYLSIYIFSSKGKIPTLDSAFGLRSCAADILKVYDRLKDSFRKSISLEDRYKKKGRSKLFSVGRREWKNASFFPYGSQQLLSDKAELHTGWRCLHATTATLISILFNNNISIGTIKMYPGWNPVLTLLLSLTVLPGAIAGFWPFKVSATTDIPDYVYPDSNAKRIAIIGMSVYLIIASLIYTSVQMETSFSPLVASKIERRISNSGYVLSESSQSSSTDSCWHGRFHH